jgi:hypothetical protein
MHPASPRPTRLLGRRPILLVSSAASTLRILTAIAYYAGQTLAARTPAAPAPDYWPTGGWRTAPTEAYGFDSAMLADGLRAIRQAWCRLKAPRIALCAFFRLARRESRQWLN